MINTSNIYIKGIFKISGEIVSNHETFMMVWLFEYSITLFLYKYTRYNKYIIYNVKSPCGIF